MLVQLKNEAAGMGIDFTGTAYIKDYLPKNLKCLPFSFTLGVRLLDAVINEVVNGATHTYFHHYRTVNTFLDQCALKIAFHIKRAGYNALCVPASQTVDSENISGLVSHKKAAALSGLGFIGKNCLFISSEFGARVRLCTVLTDMPLPYGKLIKNDCLNCNACIRACKSGALYGVAWSPEKSREDMMDAIKCSVYMKETYKNIGRGAVCGVCMAVCPYALKNQDLP